MENENNNEQNNTVYSKQTIVIIEGVVKEVKAVEEISQNFRKQAVVVTQKHKFGEGDAEKIQVEDFLIEFLGDRNLNLLVGKKKGDLVQIYANLKGKIVQNKSTGKDIYILSLTGYAVNLR